MCPLGAFLLGVVPSVVGVVVMITGIALGTALVQVIWASPVPVCTGVPVFCVVCAWAEATGDLRGGRGEISVLSELPVRDSGTSWVWDYCVMDLDLLYSMLKYIYIFVHFSSCLFRSWSISSCCQWRFCRGWERMACSYLCTCLFLYFFYVCVCTVHVYPRLTSRWILICLYLLFFLLLRTLSLYGDCPSVLCLNMSKLFTHYFIICMYVLYIC